MQRWRAGNLARSRLSGGSSRARPRKQLRRVSQTGLHRILFYISPNTVELHIGSEQTVEAFLLPKRSVGAQDKIGLVSSESFERTEPFGRKYVRSD